MAVDYIQAVGVVGFACGRGVFQAFLRRFERDFDHFDRFCRLRGLGDPLKAPHVPSYGVREAHGMPPSG
jgi:hypothetical protein